MPSPFFASDLSVRSVGKPSTPLAQAIRDYPTLGRRRFHMPGHSGQGFLTPGFDLGEACFAYDLTEVEGLDVLSEPSGPIAEAQAQAAALYGVAQSFFLVQGSTVGLQAAVLACFKPGDKVLLPRNIHRAVVAGLILTGAEPVWFLPPWLPDWGLWGGISPEQFEAQLNLQSDIQAVILTSPTYEGLGSDSAAIAALCREHELFLIVDEAHGSLWPLSNRLPPSACHSGADAVIHSLHKNAGSLTQTGLAHLPHGSRIDAVAFQQALNTLQTTSPSYLLLGSIDAALGFLASDAGRARMDFHLDHVHTLRGALHAQLQHFRLFEPEEPSFWDPTRLYLTLSGDAGDVWAPRLEQQRQIAYAAVNPTGALYTATLGLEAEDYQAFLQAFLEEERSCHCEEEAQRPTWQSPQSNRSNNLPYNDTPFQLPAMAMTPREAFFAPGTQIPAQDALGRVAKETLVHCPPGIPVLVPGEVIQEAQLPYLSETVWVVA